MGSLPSASIYIDITLVLLKCEGAEPYWRVPGKTAFKNPKLIGVNEKSFSENQMLYVQFIVFDKKGTIVVCRDILRIMKLNWEKLFDINNVMEIAAIKQKLK